MALRFVLVALLLALAGCGGAAAVEPGDGMPGDVVGEIDYRNGSVAPPYHYEWRVEFDTRTARLTWTPGYQDDETWSAAVDFGADERTRFYERLRAAGLFEYEQDTGEGLVGGPTGSTTFRRASEIFYESGPLGTSEDGQRVLDDVVAATERVFPDEVWDAMSRKQRDWADRQPK